MPLLKVLERGYPDGSAVSIREDGTEVLVAKQGICGFCNEKKRVNLFREKWMCDDCIIEILTGDWGDERYVEIKRFCQKHNLSWDEENSGTLCPECEKERLVHER